MANFVALDGEAIDGKYVLLGSSISGVCLENRQGITSDEALAWLWSLGNNRHHRKKSTYYVGFYFSYDVEMILRDLSDNLKKQIFNGVKTIYKNYSIHYIKRKFISIRRKDTQQNGITIYDVSGFFVGQGGLIGVLQKMQINVPLEIIQGKAGRQTFSWSEYATIKRYNEIECTLLVQLMNRVFDMAEKLDLVPRRWYGSSALANLALRKWEISQYMRRTVEENLSGYFWGAITRAYFGGRIEAFQLGSFQNVFTYDINSAYPATIANLPSTRNNRFIYTRTYLPNKFAVWHVRYKFPPSVHIGFFPHRQKDGSIKFPLQGEGWFWGPEVDLAVKSYGKRNITANSDKSNTHSRSSSRSARIEIIEGYRLQKISKTPLAKIVPKLYKARQEYKRKGDLTEWILKILLNSLYGKFAQKVGRADFKNFTWSGWITSQTRAQLREAVLGKEKDIIAFATDGIYSKVPIKGLTISNKLGEWSTTNYRRAVVLMSGVYLLEDEEGKQKLGTRGYARLEAWSELLDELSLRKKAKINIRVFVGFNMASNFPTEYGPSYLQFVERDKELCPSRLTKRIYNVKAIKNWKTDSCTSTSIRECRGLSEPIKTQVERVTEEDLIFQNVEDEALWDL